MTVEQTQVFNKAACLLADASGETVAAAQAALRQSPDKLLVIAEGLRAMSAVSPLADEVEALRKVLADEKPEGKKK